MFTLTDLYKAYRKAKHEAFADATQPCSLDFVKYEKLLHVNLLHLKKLLHDRNVPWYTREKIFLGHAYLPKSIEPAETEAENQAHFSSGDQTMDWARKFGPEKSKAEVNFRLVIIPSVDFQIISALWVMHVGRTYDASLDDKLAYGNRPRKSTSGSISGLSAADDSYALFRPYFSGYREWRENGIKAMREGLKEEQSVVALTMDARRYYHNISPKFLISPSFLKNNEIKLNYVQLRFTKELIWALENWYESTPDYDGTSCGAVPVGLSASKIIANVLLAEFDRIVTSTLGCRYYGRYVDDIFLVVDKDGFESAKEVMQWLRDKLDGYVVLERQRGGSTGLRVTLPYTDQSKIVFAGAKQKIFMLKGKHGLDLVGQIADQIRKSSSEHRLIPSLGEVDKILSDALLASNDAAVEADTLRKAEAMSIRRQGLSIALRNLESYARDVNSIEWLDKRESTYGVIIRHVITPVGIFNYLKQIIRVFGVMIACGDWRYASILLDKVNNTFDIVREGVDASVNKKYLNSVEDIYRRGFLESAISSSTIAGFKFDLKFRKILRLLDTDKAIFRRIGISEKVAKSCSNEMLLADLGRRPYKDYWYNDNPSVNLQPKIPNVDFIKQLSVLVRGLKPHIVRQLNDPYWPALAFSTRPPTLPEICLMMPDLMSEPDGLAKALLALRGAVIPAIHKGLALVRPEDKWLGCFVPNFPHEGTVQIAVPSYIMADDDWKAALKGAPNLSLRRYEGLTSLINSILNAAPDIDYIALPECSVPFSWAFSIAKSLSRSGVSFICGIEPNPRLKNYRNDALVSLVTNYGGYASHLLFRQPKMDLAHHEASDVSKAKLNFVKPKHPYGRPLYTHGRFCFAVLLCSDLTNINNRRALQGAVDSLFVLEWNPDVDTFSYLVESASHDLHAPVIQVNNRKYGDSRIRAPFKNDYDRDVVRVKGGDKDFFVVASFDYMSLRKFQSKLGGTDGLYKPLPIGFKITDNRNLKKLRRF